MKKASVGERVAVIAARQIMGHMTMMDFATASTVLAAWANAEAWAESPMEVLLFAAAVGPAQPRQAKWDLVPDLRRQHSRSTRRRPRLPLHAAPDRQVPR